MCPSKVLRCLFTLALAVGVGSPSLGRCQAGEEAAADYLKYKLPADAVSVRYEKRDGADIDYLDPKTREVLGSESIWEGARVKMNLFRKGKKHGVQLEWHPNGQMSAAIPYRDGVLDGVCMHWSEQGQLVGCYKIDSGKGIRLVYHSNGVLKEKTELENGLRHGEVWEFFDNGNVRTFGSWQRDRLIDMHYGFHYDDGSIRAIAKFDNNGKYHGLYVEYEHTAKLKDLALYLHGQQVTADEYRKACETDKTLPAYEQDPQDYKKLLDDESKRRIAAFKVQPRVKIPVPIPEEWRDILPVSQPSSAKPAQPVPEPPVPGSAVKPLVPKPEASGTQDRRIRLAVILGAILVGLGLAGYVARRLWVRRRGR
jgi:antitoxin component YwqK of YwqJK toxin-antitoxin module